MPVSRASASSQSEASANVSANVSGIRVADLVDRVPVGAAGRQVQRAARRHAQQPASRVEQVEEREQVALVGAAAVEEDEQPLRIPGGGSDEMVQRVRGHVPQDVICAGFAP